MSALPPKASVAVANRRGSQGPISDIRPLPHPKISVENVGRSRPCSIGLSKMLNQQFSKDPNLSPGVVSRWSDNENPTFSERIPIH
jgi:hypothetical protein